MAYYNGKKVLSVAKGGGGERPTLFAPNLEVVGNKVIFSPNANNGGFEVTTIATIDGNEVTSPLTITQALDGKTLRVVSSAENFNNGVSQVELEYIPITPVTKKIVLEISSINSQQQTNNPYIVLTLKMGTGGIPNNKAKFVYNGTDYPFSSSNPSSFSIPIQATTGRQEIDFYFEVYQQTSVSLPRLDCVLARTNTQQTASYGQPSTLSICAHGKGYGFINDELVSSADTLTTQTGVSINLDGSVAVATYNLYVDEI